MKTKVKTGVSYTDGSAIRNGDTVILWHTQERSRTPAQFVRKVTWDDEFAAFIVLCEKYGYKQYLSAALNDPNCLRITKKK